MKHVIRAVIAAVAAPVLLAAVAGPAAAANDTVYAVNDAAATTYYDYGTSMGDDFIQVCDLAGDREGAIGWIEVQQADGSWAAKPRVYAGQGSGSCASVNHDVAREQADVRLWSCIVNGPYGVPYNCGSKRIQGS